MTKWGFVCAILAGNQAGTHFRVDVKPNTTFDSGFPSSGDLFGVVGRGVLSEVDTVSAIDSGDNSRGPQGNGFTVALTEAYPFNPSIHGAAECFFIERNGGGYATPSGRHANNDWTACVRYNAAVYAAS
jgi:hypothetical protein